LDGGDADLGGRIDGVFLQVLNGVFFSELVTVVGANVVLELAESLLAQVVTIYQEENAFGASVLDQAIARIHCGKGFAAAGGHLNECARAIGGERLFQFGDGILLDLPQLGCIQRLHAAK
jgi:hypothetical protein